MVQWTSWLAVIFILSQCGFGYAHQRVLLSNVQVLTLYSGRMTEGRRSQPIPQLNCVGGSAGCSAFTPQVVQCTNKGSDGSDVQWECKSDMDNAYRFGRVEVLCEGYDDPYDPYILKGSCGLEYTLDLTKEGYNHKSHDKNHDYYGNSGYGGKGQSSNPWAFSATKHSTMGDIIFLAVIVIVIYALYRTCLYNNHFSTSSTNDDYPGSDDRRGWFGSGGNGNGHGSGTPPPPGFRPDYTTGDASCGGSGSGGYRGSRGSGFGGFWTGAATGGLLGYLFGNRNTGYNTGYNGYNTGYRATPTAPPSYGWNNSGGSSGGFFGGSSFGGGGGGASSSGTRTASGFGGTRRR